MTLAKMQQAMVLVVIASAMAWLGYFWSQGPWIAWLGFIVITLSFVVVMALEFTLLPHLRYGDPTPAPSFSDLFRAWRNECLSAFRVFFWRQPFRAQTIPDSLEPSSAQAERPLRGVVLIHGFFCNRGLWTPWLRIFRAEGRSFIALDLMPVFSSIESYAAQIDEAVTRMRQATGMAPVLVCHSMGGLAARAWLRAYAADARVAHVITLGTPHHGTWLARHSRAANGRQMRLNSTWLQQLAAQEGVERRAKFTCWYSNCDNIVFPASTATLLGAENCHLAAAGHMQLVFERRVMSACLVKIQSV